MSLIIVCTLSLMSIEADIYCPDGRDDNLIESSFQSENFQYHSVSRVQLQNIGQLTVNRNWKGYSESQNEAMLPRYDLDSAVISYTDLVE